MNFESLPINFCNRKFLNIKSDDYKKYLLDFIKTNWNIDITKKKYRITDQKIKHLKISVYYFNCFYR